MKRPKHFRSPVVLLSVAAVAAVMVMALRLERYPGQAPRLASYPQKGYPAFPPAAATASAPPPAGKPSAAAQKRAQEFNDATSRFNAP